MSFALPTSPAYVQRIRLDRDIFRIRCDSMTTMYAQEKYQRFFHVLKCTIEDLDALVLDAPDAVKTECTRILQTLVDREHDLALCTDDVRMTLHDAINAFT